MIDLQVISVEEIAAQNLELSELWMVRLGDEVFGPFKAEELKSYCASHEAVMADADVSNMATENWVMYLQSPLKPAKRKAPPQLVSATTLATHDSFYLERHGQRHGPHTHAKIVELMKSGELKPLDLISDDEGYTWHKVYQMKSIQHAQKASQLPESPSQECFQLSQEEAAYALSAEADPINEGLLSLAHAGHRKTNAALDLEALTAFKESKPLLNPQHRSWWMGGTVAAASLAGLIFWANAPGPEELQLTSTESEEVSLEAGTSLLNSRSQRRVRQPASSQPGRVNAPTAIRSANSRRELMEYRDTHDSDREIPEPAEPMDVDPYGNENQVVQDDAGQNTGDAQAARSPAAPDDGYRLEEPNPAETGPIVEEVGDF